MAMFRTVADYDKWRRRQLIERLRRLDDGPSPRILNEMIAEQGSNPAERIEARKKKRVTGYTPDQMNGGGAPAWAPSDVTGLELWLDAQDALTIALNGSNVAQWNDKSGLANSPNNLSAPNQPAYDTVGGLATVNCQAGEYLDVLSASVTGLDGPDMTVLMTFSKNGDEADSYPHALARSNGGWTAGWRVGSGNAGGDVLGLSCGAYNTDFANAYTTGNWPGTTAFGVFSGSFDSGGPTINVYRDGALTPTATDNSGAIVTTGFDLVVGSNAGGLGSYNFVGHIGEVLIYNSTLSEADRQSAEGYLAHKWGAEGLLPAGHPYKDSAP